MAESKDKPEAKAKASAKAPAKSMPMLIDWQKAASDLEAELKEKGWDSAKQRRNPGYLQGLIMRHIARPLVQAIHTKG